MKTALRHLATAFFLLTATFTAAQPTQQDFTEVRAIDNTNRYLLCQQGDTLSFIYDKDSKKSYPAIFNGKHKSYYKLCYLGERKGEPVFSDYNEIFGTNGFFAGVISSTDIGMQSINQIGHDNKFSIRNGLSKDVWLSLDDIPNGKCLKSIFDEKEFVEDGFKLIAPEGCRDSDSFFPDSPIIFNMKMPKLNYPTPIRKHILYWITDCCSLSQEDSELLSITDKTTEHDVIEYTKRNCILNNFASSDCNNITWGEHYPSGEFVSVERILNTKDYASFIIDYSNHVGGGTGYGNSYAATFDLKTNRRLTVSDIVEKEAIPTIERILERERPEDDVYKYKGRFSQTHVALGWDGLVFHYERYTFFNPTESITVPYDSIVPWLKIRPIFNEQDNSYKIKLSFEPIKSNVELEEKPDYWTPDFAKPYSSRLDMDKAVTIKNDEEMNNGCNRKNAERLREVNPKKAVEIYKKLMEEYQNLIYNKIENDYLYALSLLAKYQFSANELNEATKNCMEIISKIEDKEKYELLEFKPWNISTKEGYSPYIEAYEILSNISFKLNLKPITINVAKKTENILFTYLQQTLPRLTREKRSTLWLHYRSWLTDKLLHIAKWTQDDPLRQSAYNAQLYGKGLLMNAELAMHKYIQERGSEEEKQLFKEYLDKIEEAEKYRNSHKNEDLDDTEREMKRLESELMAFQDFSNYMNLQNVTIDMVARNMQEGELAIEFADVVEDADTTYYALTLQAGSTVPDIVRLCTGSQLRNMTTDEAVGGELHRLVWQPLARQMQGKQAVFFAPSGRLHTLPLEWACEEGSQKSMAERYAMYRLSSTREIAHVRDTIFSNESRENSTGLLVGGLNYDAAIGKQYAQNNSEETTESRRDVSLIRSGVKLKKVKKLPATLTEVEDIKPHVGRIANVGRVEMLVGSEGTEEAFKHKTEERLNLLHIATHGFYLTDEDFSLLEKSNYFSKIGKQYRDIEEKGLIRSGLVFAGINQVLQNKVAPRDANDGIMTAMEISHMDLNGVDLAVLSACQTAQGEIAQDGVMGLQRGFKKAGVASLLMSLWKVDDQATCLFMTKFYEQLAKGSSKQQALNEAQRCLRNNETYQDPRFWAAFILLDGIR